MPFFNLFKKYVSELGAPSILADDRQLICFASSSCGHYWGLSGIALAVPLYGPWHSAEAIGRTDIQNNTLYLGACLAVFFVCGISLSPLSCGPNLMLVLSRHSVRRVRESRHPPLPVQSALQRQQKETAAQRLRLQNLHQRQLQL